MKVSVLMENTPYQEGFASEHGLSLYLETKRHKILFDTGQSGRFADNAALLGVDLGSVDIAILSHGHYDHGGGIRRFLELNSHAPVYISEYAFGSYYHGAKRYIGIDQSLKQCSRLVTVQDYLDLGDGLKLCSCNDKPASYAVDDAGLSQEQGGVFTPDRFLHEQYLVIQEDGKRTVVSGCSHKGILNIMEWLHPDVLIGGFHFMKQEVAEGTNAVLDHAAAVLSGYGTEYYTCHCTGEVQYQYLKTKMGAKLHYLASGQVMAMEG